MTTSPPAVASPPTARRRSTHRPAAPLRTQTARERRRPWLAPTALAAALAAVYLLIEPRAIDLAAHEYRAGLFERQGFTLWNGNWYGGHHTPAYSLLFPPLAALLGPALVGAFSVVGGSAAFDALARRHWGERAKWGSLWFAAGMSTVLWSGRLPFGMGIAIAIAALLLLHRRQRAAACGVALLASLASPVAGFFLAISGAAVELTGRRRGGGAMALAALAPIGFLSLAFPEGGWFPFHFSTFFPVVLFAAVAFVLLPSNERALRAGALIYGALGVGFYLWDTPMGANYVRLGALVGGPVLLCAVSGRRITGRAQVAIGLALAALLVWQWSPAVRDFRKALEDPSAEAGYYDELVRFLGTLPAEPGRVEIPFTRSHWESAEVAAHVPLARGWQRQLDIGRNRIFYGGALSDLSYLAWLTEHGVRYVALPGVKPDYSSYHERGLIERDPPYLRKVWSSDEWRVYELTVPVMMAVPRHGADIEMARLGEDDFELEVRRPGEALVRVRWSPYWWADGACVEPDGDWTRVVAERPGRLRVSMRFSPERLVERGRRCG